MFRYLQGLIDLFGKFDQDQDGVVEFNEFRDLWTHLGGEPPIVGAAAAAVKGEQLDAARSKEFSKFDLNADGVLSARGATATHPPGLCLSLSLSLSPRLVCVLLERAERDGPRPPPILLGRALPSSPICGGMLA